MEVIFRFYFGGHFPLKILPKNIWRSFSGFAFEQNSYGGHFPIFVWGSFSYGGHFHGHLCVMVKKEDMARSGATDPGRQLPTYPIFQNLIKEKIFLKFFY